MIEHLRKLLRLSFSLVLVCTLFSTFAPDADAAGTFQLKGTVKSFSPDELLINDGEQVFHLKRKTLPATEQAKLKNLKAKMELELTVPFASVSSVD